MKKLFCLVMTFLGLHMLVHGQHYTSYFTGDTVDVESDPAGGLCLMGGGSENDSAMTWFLRQARGGDVVVLRASGSDSYNEYLYSKLGVSVNSVETIVFHDSAASAEAYIHQRIQRAEALWIAGGDQWDYVSFWRHTAIDSLINEAIAHRNMVIGGTSAGMAILGGFYFTAEHGTISSSHALSNPYDQGVKLDSSRFITVNYMSDIITDTHYDNPDRRGRHIAFMARILSDYGIESKGIACDEFTAVCIDSHGLARVYGSYPEYDDNAYFLQTNCELTDVMPESCMLGRPLTWSLDSKAISVYAIKGTQDGSNTFDLSDWKSGIGGRWEYWSVEDGVLSIQPGLEPLCISVSASDMTRKKQFEMYPNPAKDVLKLRCSSAGDFPQSMRLVNHLGQVIRNMVFDQENEAQMQIDGISAGVYYVEILYRDKNKVIRKVLIQ